MRPELPSNDAKRAQDFKLTKAMIRERFESWLPPTFLIDLTDLSFAGQIHCR